MFKKVFILLLLISMGYTVFAQTTDSTSVQKSIDPKPFRHWSFGVNAGMLTAYSPFNAQEDFRRSGLDFGYGGYIKYQMWPVLALQANILRGNVSGTEAFSGAYIDYRTSLKYAADISANLSFFTARFNQNKNFIRPYLTAGYGLASYQPTFTDIEGTVYVVDHNIHNVYVPVGLGFMVGLARRINFDFGYKLNLINGDNLDAYNYGSNKDQISYFHVGLAFQIGNPKPPVKTVKPNKSIIQEPLENTKALGNGKDSLIKGADTVKVKVKDNAESTALKPKLDSDGDGIVDEKDKCPDSPAGVQVDSLGCPVEINKGLLAKSSIILFDYNSAVLKTVSYDILDSISADLRAEPLKRIEINGYASAEGSTMQNINLSKDRANAIKTYLMNTGVDKKNLTANGFGEANPIADNSTEKGRMMNRRAEINVLKKDTDRDGVPDERDKCPDTPEGNAVNEFGCLIEGRKVHIKGYATIYFDVNSSVLKTSSYVILEAIVADLKANPSKNIEINGYASSEGTVAHNVILSKDRANTVKTFLINAGANGKNLKTNGYGEANPIGDNSTEKGRRKNRRVEVN